MEKIVILNGSFEENDMLIRCLRTLFPECEILAGSKMTEALGDVQAISGPAAVYTGGQKSGKNLDC